MYPNEKLDNIELMSMLYTEKDCKTIAKDHGYTDKEIAKLF